MNKDNDIITEYHIVTDGWRLKEYDNKDDALKELGNNVHALFIYRTFLKKANSGSNTTGEVEFLQDISGEWSHVLSFNDWQVDGLDTRGFPFKFKDPKGEIRQTDGSQESLEELFAIKWPDEAPYISFAAKILSMLSKYNSWDDYESSKS